MFIDFKINTIKTKTSIAKTDICDFVNIYYKLIV